MNTDSIYPSTVGTYLFVRILKNGHDSRFDGVKDKPRLFIIFWLVQALWVLICCLPVIVINAISVNAFDHLPAVLVTDLLGLAVFIAGFVLEIVADYQKACWLEEKRKKLHDDQFITRGIWGRRQVT